MADYEIKNEDANDHHIGELEDGKRFYDTYLFYIMCKYFYFIKLFKIKRYYGPMVKIDNKVKEYSI